MLSCHLCSGNNRPKHYGTHGGDTRNRAGDPRGCLLYETARNMLCGMPVLEVDEVCDLLKMSDRQLRRYRTSGPAHRLPLRTPSAVFVCGDHPFHRTYRSRLPTEKIVEKSCPQSLIYIVMSDNTTERTYCLVESGIFERLLKTYFMQAQSLLLFEHLLGQSDRPMFLSAARSARPWGSTATNWNNTGANALSKPVLSTDR